MDEQVTEEIILFDQQKTTKEETQRAFPWYSQRTRKLVDPILRLHNETIQFLLYVSAFNDKNEHQKNLEVFEKIKKIVFNSFPSANVIAPFFLKKLYLKDTQIELYVLQQDLTQQKAIFLSTKLIQAGVTGVSFPPQTQQNYKIFQLQIEVGAIKVNIRMLEKDNWQEFFSLIEENIDGIVELKYVYIILSCMVRQRWLQLTIRPYLLLALLSVFYHQRRKQKHRTLTENILKFLQYYGVGPFQQRRVNYLGKGRYQLIQQGQQGTTPFSFWINGQCNIASPQLRQLFNLLKNRYRLISNYNFDDQQSIIGSLVNPCQKQFEYI